MRYLLCVVAVGVALFATQATAATVAQARLEVDDLLGNPISSIGVGNDFLLKMYVRDVRVPPAQFGSVIQAYFDVAFDAARVDALNPITYGAQFQNLHSGTIGANTIVDVGAADLDLNPVGQVDQLLFTVRFNAETLGPAAFSSALSSVSGHDLAMYLIDGPVPAGDIERLPITLNIVPEPTSFALLGMAIVILAITGAVRVRGNRL